MQQKFQISLGSIHYQFAQNHILKKRKELNNEELLTNLLRKRSILNLDKLLLITPGSNDLKSKIIFNELNQVVKLISYSNIDDVSKLEKIESNAKKLLDEVKILDPQSDQYKKIINSFSISKFYINELNNKIFELKKRVDKNLFDLNKIKNEQHKIVTQLSFRHSIFSYISIIIVSLVLTIFIFTLKTFQKQKMRF